MCFRFQRFIQDPIYIYILLDILVCSIIEYFNQPVEQVKMQTMSKTTWQY